MRTALICAIHPTLPVDSKVTDTNGREIAEAITGKSEIGIKFRPRDFYPETRRIALLGDPKKDQVQRLILYQTKPQIPCLSRRPL
jgi:hypothetical protein